MSFLRRFIPSLRKLNPAGRSHRTYTGPLVFAAQLILVGHAFGEYCYWFSLPYGGSMIPTLDFEGEGLIVSKYYRRGRGVTVGDIVTFKHPVKWHKGALKRVIGMPGDYVLLNSPDNLNSDAMIQVPEGHCFVAGDNLPHSNDSRLFGPMPLALIEGKIIYRWWPYSQAGPLGNNLAEVDLTEVD